MPALGIFFIFTICDDLIFAELIKKYIPKEVVASKDYNFTIVLAQINNSVEGLIFGTPPQWVTNAAEIWLSWVHKSQIITVIICISTALISGFLGYKKICSNFRSRNAVEKIVMSILAVSSVIAILTTIAIIFLLFLNLLDFLHSYRMMNFYLEQYGTHSLKVLKELVLVKRFVSVWCYTFICWNFSYINNRIMCFSACWVI